MARYGEDFDRGRYDYGARGHYGPDYGYRGSFPGRYGSEYGWRYGGTEAGRFDEDRYAYRQGYDFGYARPGYGGGRYNRFDPGYDAHGTGYAGYATDYADRPTGYGWTGYGYGWQGTSRARHPGASRVRASDIMTYYPEAVTGDATLAEAAQKMRDLDVGIIPVVESPDNQRLRGVITDRDIAIRAVAETRDPASTKVSEVMTTEVDTCNQNDPVQQVIDAMERSQVRRIPITDREGRLVGIIAQADIAVDYRGGRSDRDWQVAEVLERVSEPGRPRRGGEGAIQAQAGQSQGAQGAGSPEAGSRGKGQSRTSRARKSQKPQQST